MYCFHIVAYTINVCYDLCDSYRIGVVYCHTALPRLPQELQKPFFQRHRWTWAQDATTVHTHACTYAQSYKYFLSPVSIFFFSTVT